MFYNLLQGFKMYHAWFVIVMWRLQPQIIYGTLKKGTNDCIIKGYGDFRCTMYHELILKKPCYEYRLKFFFDMIK